MVEHNTGEKENVKRIFRKHSSFLLFLPGNDLDRFFSLVLLLMMEQMFLN
jgi:hypothetical protein